MVRNLAKIFNVTAVCRPEQHYMVNIDGRLRAAKELVDNGMYFIINKARQYGKTTILRSLCNYLRNEYYVVFMDFQKISSAKFKNENSFSLTFARLFFKNIIKNIFTVNEKINKEFSSALDQLDKIVKSEIVNFELTELFENLSGICGYSDKPVILIVDEIDSAENNQVFIDFLSQLRAYYIDRDNQQTFQSVILAGVYDVKNIVRKIRPEEEHKINSPWNIAADFGIEMSFSKKEIAGMLNDYEADYNTGMDINQMAGLVYDYTSGYPYLVSKLCKHIDEKVYLNKQYGSKNAAWTRKGFNEALRQILSEKNTLFESLTGKLESFPELNSMLRSLLFTGKSIVYNPDEQALDIATMFGFIKEQNGTAVIANRIFETRLYNFYLSSAEMQGLEIYKASLQDKNQFVVNEFLNMRLVLEKFVQHFTALYGNNRKAFIEEEGRKYFLLYLKPIINGTGNYYIESRTRELRRTDIIVDYHNEQYIIEMKIWHGNEYNRRGEKQLAGYLDDYNKNKGYMVSFNFNKNKQIGVSEIVVGDKVIVEAVV